MSPIGRIFVVLNLILAAVFLGWASTSLATAENWRQQHDDSKQEHEAMLAEKDQAVSTLQVKSNTLTDEHSRTRTQRDHFEAEVEKLKTQLGDERRRGDKLAGDITAIQASLSDYSDTITQLSSEKERILERLTAAEQARDQAKDQVMAIEMEKRDIQDALRRAEGMVEDLTEQLGGIAGLSGN